MAGPAAPAVVATVVRERLESRLAPEQALLTLRDDPRPFALVGVWAGARAVLGSEPVAVLEPGEDPFALLERLPAVRGEAGGALVGGGWVGHLGFELRHRVEPGGAPPPRPLPQPAAGLAFHDHVLVLDTGGTWWFEALWTAERAEALTARRALLRERLRAAAPPAPRAVATRGWAWTPSLAAHARLVDACRDRIAAGDLFQANVCARLDGTLAGEAIDLFAMAAAALPTDRAAFVGAVGATGPALVSLSPELFLARRGRRVRSAPIKGTRPIGEAAALSASEKDLAENVMIVDLVRNDLGRVCVPGTVRVAALAEPRPHAGVAHLVSEVEGTLRDGVGDAELLRATFPPGSVTGAPKLAALEVIAELESTGREAYTGAIGLASPLAGLELSVAIRTFEVAAGGRIWLGAGGGIVADSDPAAEAREVQAKAAPLLAAIGAAAPAGVAADAGGAAPRIRRRGPRPLPRPDPAAGLYETLLVVDGALPAGTAHLARLTGSFRALYGGGLDAARLAREVADAARATTGRARLRIDATPDGAYALTTSAWTPPAPAVLRPEVVPGGLGPHKWRDRRLLEALEADDPATLPLLVDADGIVLEASRANVVARLAPGGPLLTPPADGRILPGVTRARTGAQERVLTLAELGAAAELYVTSALRDLQPAVLA
jgi:para-aminobenzoate synthetase/4-amino-4-deoxychorismate lyase